LNVDLSLWRLNNRKSSIGNQWGSGIMVNLLGGPHWNSQLRGAVEINDGVESVLAEAGLRHGE
jgi:hypothetical protein